MEAGSRSRRLFERPVSTETEALTPEESIAVINNAREQINEIKQLLAG